MTLKHPKGPQPPANDLSVAPLFTREAARIRATAWPRASWPPTSPTRSSTTS